jgi:hypothetical protein
MLVFRVEEGVLVRKLLEEVVSLLISLRLGFAVPVYDAGARVRVRRRPSSLW